MGFSFLEVEGTVIHVVHPEHWVPANPPASVVSLLSWEAEERKRFVLFFISPKSASQKHWRNCWEGASLLTRDAEQSLKEEGEWALGHQSQPEGVVKGRRVGGSRRRAEAKAVLLS